MTERVEKVTGEQRADMGALVRHGIVGGLIAGAVFLIAQMVINRLLGDPATEPLRAYGSLIMGEEVMTRTDAGPVVAGALLWMGLAALFGVLFAFIVAALKQLGRKASWLLPIHGMIFGLILWLVLFRGIFPGISDGFDQLSQLWNGFVAHTFFYGLPLGAYIGSVRPALNRAHDVDHEYRPGSEGATDRPG